MKNEKPVANEPENVWLEESIGERFNLRFRSGTDTIIVDLSVRVRPCHSTEMHVEQDFLGCFDIECYQDLDLIDESDRREDLEQYFSSDYWKGNSKIDLAQQLKEAAVRVARAFYPDAPPLPGE